MKISKSASRITKFTRGPSVASYLHEKQTSRIQSLSEHHSQISKSCLVMIIGHSYCEKGYKVYNISDNDHNQWTTSLKVNSNMTRGQ